MLGPKQKILLEENGLKVIEIGQNATELAQKIAKNYKKLCFFITSAEPLRREELPKALKSEKISLFEGKKHTKTVLKTKKFDQKLERNLVF